MKQAKRKAAEREAIRQEVDRRFKGVRTTFTLCMKDLGAVLSGCRRDFTEGKVSREVARAIHRRAGQILRELCKMIREGKGDVAPEETSDSLKKAVAGETQ